MHQVSRTVDSITLSWSQPDQPNGVILDYELQYYEKVPVPTYFPGAPLTGPSLADPQALGLVQQEEPWPPWSPDACSGSAAASCEAWSVCLGLSERAPTCWLSLGQAKACRQKLHPGLPCDWQEPGDVSCHAAPQGVCWQEAGVEVAAPSGSVSVFTSECLPQRNRSTGSMRVSGRGRVLPHCALSSTEAGHIPVLC